MSNIEKIRQEIERRKKICEGIFERESDTYYQGKAVAYGELLPFIDSLPEEKLSEDLDEAVEKHINEALFKWSYDDEDGIEQYVHDAFIAGAKWHEQQMMKEAVEGEVYRYESYQRIATAIIVDIPREILGNKVKIIIVKQ